MEFLEHLIKTSLLGTERQSIDKSLLPESSIPYIEKIEEKHKDKEDQFLQSAALLINYFHSGNILDKASFNLPKPAEEETFPYCNEKSIRSLYSVFEAGHGELLEYWLKKCIDAQQIIPPETLTMLMEEGRKNIKLRHLIKDVVGNRGHWLASFNDEWKFLKVDEQEIWETGKSEERKQLLIQLRQTNPERGRALLSSSWKEENANTRVDLLAILSINISADDEEFLNEALKDNSAKVKNTAQDLLSKLSDSEYIKEIWQITKHWLTLKSSKSLLLATKEEIEMSIPSTFPPELKKKGIQELSSSKMFTDQEYWLAQLTGLIPPSYFEQHLGIDPVKIISLFSKDKSLQKVIQEFVESTIRHKDSKWAKILLEEKLKSNEYVKINSIQYLYDLFDLLGDEDKKHFYDNNLDKKEFPFKLTLIDFLNALDFNWDLPFTIKALKQVTADSQEGYIYGYPKLVALSQFAHTSVLDHLREIEPVDNVLKDRWNTLFGRLFKIMEVKREIDEGFAGK